MTRTALIIGITGNIGAAAAEAFIRHGWDVRAVARDVGAARGKLPCDLKVEWRQGDARHAEDLARAAMGVSVILHAANPPGYRNWQGLALPMLNNAIDAAFASGARLIFPGNIYPYGPDAWPLVHEGSPQNPVTRKGRVRVEMEQRLEAAARRGVRSLILRAGDFFGSANDSSWFAAVMVKPGRSVESVMYPGDPEVGHAWAYLPDLAETLVRLAGRERELADFQRLHFAGHYLRRGGDMAEAIQRVASRDEMRVRRLPWGLLRLMAPFNKTLRELMEMRYLWYQDIALDNSRLLSILGEEPHTPLDRAVEATLRRLGCLELPAGAPRAPA